MKTTYPIIFAHLTIGLCTMSAVADLALTGSVWSFLLILAVSLFPLVYILHKMKCLEAQRLAALDRVKDSRESDLYTRVCEIVERHKCYLRRDFRIEDLSEMANSNKSAISSAINHFSGMNFNQFLNKYRVECAVDLIKGDIGMKMWNISDLAGFANTNTFNSAFKKHKGMTPTEVRDEIVKQRISQGETIMRPSLDKMVAMS